MSLELSGTTGVKGVAGSVSAPSIVGDDTNTGISFPAADTIKFSTGGVERLSISNSGLSGDGSGLSGISAGITMADQWRLTSNLTMSQNTGTAITANWERVDTDGFGQLGTGMTESSGNFVFPSTGIYLIRFIPITYAGTSAAAGNRIRIYSTIDDGTYGLAAETFISNYSQYTQSTGVCEFQFDVTNVSTHKVRFQYYTGGTGVQLQANSGLNQTHVTFVRLGDT